MRSSDFWQKSYGPSKILGNLHGKDILSAISGKFTDDESCLVPGMQNFDYKFSFNLEKKM